ncbi:hypothetical protein [Candidatus Nitrososphaera evergladensis]|uniref:hypothetical protein n=1 Tax=Candidatus Nitrososphaera evergladensis TaxID=1459637 RepID=UPI0011E590F0|nr:hypothetical protein [Candidatus Nitrososphaera evergladensis]
MIHGELIYLERAGLIEGFYAVGRAWPTNIKISSYGIDTVEGIINQSLGEIAASSEESIKQKTEEIINESDQQTKIQKFRDFVGRNAG